MDICQEITDRKRPQIEKEATDKQKEEQALNLLVEKARQVWAVQTDVTKMKNKQLLTILCPLRQKDDPPIPTRKDQLLNRYAEWSHRITPDMITPPLSATTPPPPGTTAASPPSATAPPPSATALSLSVAARPLSATACPPSATTPPPSATAPPPSATTPSPPSASASPSHPSANAAPPVSATTPPPLSAIAPPPPSTTVALLSSATAPSPPSATTPPPPSATTPPPPSATAPPPLSATTPPSTAYNDTDSIFDDADEEDENNDDEMHEFWKQDNMILFSTQLDETTYVPFDESKESDAADAMIGLSEYAQAV